MNPVRLITAISTPLTDSEQLHREGLQAHLDDQHAGGIKSLLVGGTATAAEVQNRLNHIRRRMIDAGLWGAFTAIMNARGIPGRFAPRTAAMLSDTARARLLDDTVVDSLIQSTKTMAA